MLRVYTLLLKYIIYIVFDSITAVVDPSTLTLMEIESIDFTTIKLTKEKIRKEYKGLASFATI